MQTKCLYFKKKLTAEYLEKIKSDNDLQISDTEVPGYHLRYSKQTDRKVLYLHYDLRLDGVRKERNLKLGAFPEISAPDARAEAIRYRGQVLSGIDPMFERQERLRQTMGEQDKKIPLKVVIEKYLEEHSKPLKKAGTSQREFQLARKYVIPMLGNLPINEVNVRHLEKMHLTIGEHTQVQANHCLMFLSYFLNWCEKQEYRTLGTNPVRLIRKFKTKGRDRVLSDDEYQRVFEAMDLGRRTNLLNPIGFDILTLIIFTGCRSSEAKHLTWDEVDFDNSILRLKDSKTGAKSIPVSKIALDIIRAALPNKTGSSSPVFPAVGGKAFSESGLAKHWDFIREHAKLENANIHDLRHSFATTGSMTGENIAVIGKVLGHTTIATTSRYTHINNIKGIEVANNIAERIAKKAHLKKRPTAQKLMTMLDGDDAETETETRGRRAKKKDTNAAPKKRGRPSKKKK
jgi:integrase